MRNLTILIVALIALAGCATSRSVRQADGWMTHVVNCGGPFLNMGHCLEKAGDVCGGYGYTVLNQKGGEVPPANAIPTGGGPDLPDSVGELFDSQPRQLFIRCN